MHVKSFLLGYIENIGTEISVPDNDFGSSCSRPKDKRRMSPLELKKADTCNQKLPEESVANKPLNLEQLEVQMWYLWEENVIFLGTFRVRFGLCLVDLGLH